MEVVLYKNDTLQSWWFTPVVGGLSFKEASTSWKLFCFEENDTFKENGTQVMVVYLNFLNLTFFSETGSR